MQVFACDLNKWWSWTHSKLASQDVKPGVRPRTLECLEALWPMLIASSPIVWEGESSFLDAQAALYEGTTTSPRLMSHLPAKVENRPLSLSLCVCVCVLGEVSQRGHLQSSPGFFLWKCFCALARPTPPNKENNNKTEQKTPKNQKRNWKKMGELRGDWVGQFIVCWIIFVCFFWFGYFGAIALWKKKLTFI